MHHHAVLSRATWINLGGNPSGPSRPDLANRRNRSASAPVPPQGITDNVRNRIRVHEFDGKGCRGGGLARNAPPRHSLRPSRATKSPRLPARRRASERELRVLVDGVIDHVLRRRAEPCQSRPQMGGVAQILGVHRDVVGVNRALDDVLSICKTVVRPSPNVAASCRVLIPRW
jgi:hypothetical protein